MLFEIIRRINKSGYRITHSLSSPLYTELSFVSFLFITVFYDLLAYARHSLSIMTFHILLIRNAQNEVVAIWVNGDTVPLNPSGLDFIDSSFLNETGDNVIFGHNNGTSTTIADVPATIDFRLDRIWYCDINDFAPTVKSNHVVLKLVGDPELS